MMAIRGIKLQKTEMSERDAERLGRKLCAFLGFDVEVLEDAAAWRHGVRPISVKAEDRREPRGASPSFYSWRYWSWNALVFGYQDANMECDYEESLLEMMADYIESEGRSRAHLYGFDYMRATGIIQARSVSELELRLAALGY